MSAIEIVLIVVFVIPIVGLTLTGTVMAIGLQSESNRRKSK